MGLRGENRPGRARRGRAGTKPGLSGTDRDGRHRVRNRGVAPLAVAGARSDHLVGGGGTWAVKERGEELWARRGFAPPEEEEDPGGGAVRCSPRCGRGGRGEFSHTRCLRDAEGGRSAAGICGGKRRAAPLGAFSHCEAPLHLRGRAAFAAGRSEAAVGYGIEAPFPVST